MLRGSSPYRFAHILRQYDQVIQAAVAGQGVALGRMALIEPLLAEGRLVKLRSIGKAAAIDHAYWLIQADPQPRDDVVAVVNWMLAEARQVDALLSARHTDGPIGGGQRRRMRVANDRVVGDGPVR